MQKNFIVIPAYEPDERLITLLEELRKEALCPIVIVDDGSGASYRPIFEKAGALISDRGGCLLTHEVNRGKGRALKTAFSYLLEKEKDLGGVVTADSDGQHTVASIRAMLQKMQELPESLVLGVRKFDGEDVPWKSRFGNQLTEKLFAYVSGVHVTDTQTGLRGIPKAFMEDLLSVKGERFEFEMRMLLEAAGHYPIIEIPIETIYDSKENHQTHFDPFKDSIRIYRILGEKFFKFLFSSLSSSVVDLTLFALFCYLIKEKYPVAYAGIATVMARILSAVYNYTLNYKIVFKSKANGVAASLRYAILAVLQMGCSAGAILMVLHVFPGGPELLFKVVIDTILFLISYKIQQKFVF